MDVTRKIAGLHLRIAEWLLQGRTEADVERIWLVLEPFHQTVPAEGDPVSFAPPM